MAIWNSKTAGLIGDLPVELGLLVCKHFFEFPAPTTNLLDPFLIPPSEYDERSSLSLGAISRLQTPASRALYKHIFISSARRFDKLLNTLRPITQRARTLRSMVNIITIELNEENCDQRFEVPTSMVALQLIELAGLLPDIKILNIKVAKSNALDARVAAAFNQFSKVEELQVTGVALGAGNVIFLLSGMPAVRKLRLQGLIPNFSWRMTNGRSNVGSMPIPNYDLSALTSLDLHTCDLTANEFARLTASTSLTHLALNHAGEQTPVSFRGMLPNARAITTTSRIAPILANADTLLSLCLVLPEVYEPAAAPLVGDQVAAALVGSRIQHLAIGGERCLSAPAFFDHLSDGWTSLRTLLLTGCSYNLQRRDGLSPAGFKASLGKQWTESIQEVVLNGMDMDVDAEDETAWDWDTQLDLVEAVGGKFKLRNRAFDNPAARRSTRIVEFPHERGFTAKTGKRGGARTKSRSSSRK